MLQAQVPLVERDTGHRRQRATLLAGFGLCVAVASLSLASLLVGAGTGPDAVGPGRALDFLLGAADPRAETVVLGLRLPRTLTALAVGTALGTAGALLQAITRNPLAETGLLGVNAGAALGVVLGITYAGAEPGAGYLGWALLGGIMASAVVLLVAGSGRTAVAASPLRLVLAGSALEATLRGATAFLLLGSAATYDQYRFWAVGSLVRGTTATVLSVLPAIALGLLIGLAAARPLSALGLGDDVARALGHRPRVIRLTAAAAVALLTGASVALAGPLAFLGLLAPHVARAVTGPRLTAQLPLSAGVGAAVLLVADLAARVIVRPFEAPVGVLLAAIGGPALVCIARSNRLLTLNTPGGGDR